MKESFTHLIEQWYAKFGRDLPWRQTRNPYYIWLSEIILQQTRVDQGRDYYRRFVEAYPDVHALAQASETEVMRLWQGLGYYSRARNLHAAAKQIDAMRYDFPSDYKIIRSLQGVGDYTAAAIASFAFDLPYAVLDGNVYRVLSRFFAIETPIDTTSGKKEFSTLAQSLIDVKQPALYNQAIMDFGAMVCKPLSPLCYECPLSASCQALSLHKVNLLPIKTKKMNLRDRYFTYIKLLTRDGKILIHQRNGKDIWQSLYEFPLIESTSPLSVQEVQNQTPEGELTLLKQGIIHQLTHQRLHVDIYEMIVNEETDYFPGKWIALTELNQYGLPQLLVKNL